MDFVAALKLCQQGLDVWKSQEHNYKWWRRIDGTPIPNDLLVCIAEAVRDAVQTDSAQGQAVADSLSAIVRGMLASAERTSDPRGLRIPILTMDALWGAVNAGALEALRVAVSAPAANGDQRMCHALGEICPGCPHYYGRADVCAYADLASTDDVNAFREAIRLARNDMAALLPDPSNPDFTLACPNKADAECLTETYNRLTEALQ